MIEKERLPEAEKIKEGTTPNEGKQPSVYGEVSARIPHDRGVMYGDWHYINGKNNASWSKKLTELSESLLGTVLRHGIPMHLEWIVNLDDKTQNVYFGETVGWKGLFAKDGERVSAASTIAALEEAGEKWRAKNMEIVKQQVLDKCVEAITQVLSEEVTL